MILIIGLGNPGDKFNNTPHNVGFEVLDSFAKKNNLGEFALQKKSEAEVLEETLNDKKIVLAKPQTFMNNSGKTAKKLFTKDSELIVVHDDIDLLFGTIKISKDRGSAGHKGVDSIIKAIGTQDFIRLRIGIQPATGKPDSPEKFVLKKFDKGILQAILEKSTNALHLLIEQGLEKAMNECN